MSKPTAEVDLSDFRLLFEASPTPCLILTTSYTILAVNEAYLRLMGEDRDRLLGRCLVDVFPAQADPAVASALRDSFERVLCTREPDGVVLKYVMVPAGAEQHGPARSLRATNSALAGPDGEVRFLVHHIEDVTAAVREHSASRAALVASEERFGHVLESVTEYAIFAIDRQGRVMAWNAGAERILGFSEEEALGMHASMIFVPEDRASGAPEMEMTKAIKTGRARNERWHIRKDGTRFWATGVTMLMRGDEQEIRGFLKILRDRTEQRNIEAALRESEARFRHMADSAPALIWMTDERGQMTFANMRYDYTFGVAAAEMLGDGWQRFIHPSDLPRFIASFDAAFARRQSFRIEIRVKDRHDATRWLRCEGVPRLDDHGAFLGYTGCNIDITDTKVSEQRQRLLVNELNHRVKNTLATVQAIAMQTLRSVEDPAKARESLIDRLMALARAHDVLTAESWTGANLRDIVQGVIEVFRAANRERFVLDGPEVRLTPRIALSFTLALHELATNAVKYGALSSEGGCVRIEWSLSRPDDVQRLKLAWRESGGPPVEPPQRRGFGSRLIERGLASELGGVVSLDFDPGGVVCVIDAPLQSESSEPNG